MSEEEPKVCERCGAAIDRGDRYCATCGSPIAVVQHHGRARPKLVAATAAAVVAVIAVIVVVTHEPVPAVHSFGPTAEGKTDGNVPARLILKPLSPDIAAIEAVGAVRGDPDGAPIGLLRQAADTFAARGRPDHAAALLRRIAEETGATEDWRLTGNLWMRSMDRADLRVPGMAAEAVEAYRRVLAVDPTLLDVRTDLATAYLGAKQPEAALLELRIVLVEDTLHLPARFNYAVMLSITGQADEAISQLARTMELAEPGSHYFERAREAIRSIEERDNIAVR